MKVGDRAEVNPVVKLGKGQGKKAVLENGKAFLVQLSQGHHFIDEEGSGARRGF